MPLPWISFPSRRRARSSLRRPSWRGALAVARDEAIRDEGQLLLNAAAHRIAYDGMRTVGSADLVVLPLPGGEAATRYAETLAAMLQASGLAEYTPTGALQLAGTDLPGADTLIAGILAERPELGAECALLARLADLLPDLLTGRLDWDLEALFGRAALARLIAPGDAMAELLAGALPGDRPFRVAELVDGAPALLDGLLERRDRATGSTIGTDGDGADEGPFDLVVACPKTPAGTADLRGTGSTDARWWLVGSGAAGAAGLSRPAVGDRQWRCDRRRTTDPGRGGRGRGRVVWRSSTTVQPH